MLPKQLNQSLLIFLAFSTLLLLTSFNLPSQLFSNGQTDTLQSNGSNSSNSTSSLPASSTSKSGTGNPSTQNSGTPSGNSATNSANSTANNKSSAPATTKTVFSPALKLQLVPIIYRARQNAQQLKIFTLHYDPAGNKPEKILLAPHQLICNFQANLEGVSLRENGKKIAYSRFKNLTISQYFPERTLLQADFLNTIALGNQSSKLEYMLHFTENTQPYAEIACSFQNLKLTTIQNVPLQAKQVNYSLTNSTYLRYGDYNPRPANLNQDLDFRELYTREYYTYYFGLGEVKGRIEPTYLNKLENNPHILRFKILSVSKNLAWLLRKNDYLDLPLKLNTKQNLKNQILTLRIFDLAKPQEKVQTKKTPSARIWYANGFLLQ